MSSDSNIGTDSNDEEITKSQELFTDEDSSTVTVGNSVGKAKIIENATDEEDLDEFDEPPGNIASNKSMSKCNAPLVRLETNGMLKCIKAKQLCDDGRVKFDESKAIWMVNDCEKWFLVTVFPNYGCSCVDTPSCCHVLAVKSKLGMQIKKLTYKPTQLSAIMSSRTSGSTKKSASGSKRKYQTRNAIKATFNGDGEGDIISNGHNYLPYLMQLVTSEHILENFNSKILFNETEIQTDSSKLTKIFLDDTPDLKVTS
jgi:hypothetical protein